MEIIDSIEVRNMFRIRRTAARMLQKRGYNVSAEDTDLTELSFEERFGRNPKREELVLLCENDYHDSIFVFFPEEPKLGVKEAVDYLKKMQDEGVKRAILVVRLAASPQARNARPLA